MTPEEAFLLDIAEHPDDDAPRLIFADWLEDNGKLDRAEFIRTQIEICRLAYGPDRAERTSRAERLLQTHWDEWLAPLRALLKGDASRLREGWLVGPFQASALSRFHRGFLDSFSLPTATLLRAGDVLFLNAPVRSLSLTGAGPLAAELAVCPHLSRLRDLQFIDYYSGPINADAARALARSPHLGRLTSLNLYNNALGDAGLAALADAPWLTGMTDLHLGNNGLSILGALIDTRHFFRPVALSLGSNGLRGHDIFRLLSSPLAERLTRLDLRDNGLGDAGVVELAWSPGLASVRDLNLNRNGIGERGVRALLESPYLGNLHALGLESNPLTHGALRLLRNDPRTRAGLRL